MATVKGYGKKKGAGYERHIANTLSLWISGGTNKNLLWRSAMSGGRSTVARKKGEANAEQALDLSAISPEGDRLISKCCIECKNYKDLGLARFLLGMPSDLTTFWNETLDAASHNKKYPILI